MSEPFLATIVAFGGNFAPRGWAMCNGQILAIAQNTALFSLLGTTYGGNGQTTFALPDLRSRAPVHFGQGPGLSSYDLGQQGGSETQALTVNNLPPHSHAASASTNPTSKNPSGKLVSAVGTPAFGDTADVTLSPLAIGPTGAGVPVSTVQPYLAINFIIALEGIFPSRN